MLLLRSAIGLAALVQGATYLGSQDSTSAGLSGAAILAVLSGTSLLIGFLTPVAGGSVGLVGVAIEFSLMAAPAPTLFGGWLSLVFIAMVAGALILLGPGAFSLDARLFGRRQVIIPRPPRSKS